jgi:hypothetical protein
MSMSARTELCRVAACETDHSTAAAENGVPSQRTVSVGRGQAQKIP